MNPPHPNLDGFGIYIHWPFCQSKCPYCDFNSHVANAVDQEEWSAAYVLELERIALLTNGRLVNSIFFGGGTPSLMLPKTVFQILDTVFRLWPIANDIEITLEANPGSVEAERFKQYRLSGVNRLSLGVQALNDTDLRRLGRLHSHAEALQAFDIARSTFDRVSFDLIYARQDQTLAQWKTELTQALNLAVDHLSLYQLTIEDDTVFGERFAKGMLRGLPDEDLSVDMFQMTQEICAANGLPAYEVSNHARSGAESRHNLIYWRGGDYAGIGPGAHGRLVLDGQRYATLQPRDPKTWLQQVRDAGNGDELYSLLTLKDRADEYLIMSLRLSEGTVLERYENLKGQAVPNSVLRELGELGKISVEGGRLKATPEGKLLLNQIIRKIAGG